MYLLQYHIWTNYLQTSTVEFSSRMKCRPSKLVHTVAHINTEGMANTNTAASWCRTDTSFTQHMPHQPSGTQGRYHGPPMLVNDYHILNSNIILDSHPYQELEDIPVDCPKGKIWSKLDMTNSFFQTHIHPDDVHRTAVTTPFSLWVVSHANGLAEFSSNHQRRMASALRELISKICHIYLDDIIIWSSNVEEHEKHIHLVLATLQKASCTVTRRSASSSNSILSSSSLNFCTGHQTPNF